MSDLTLPPEIIVAPRTDPIYNCHGYLTKVPVSAITPFINAFSEVDEIVADPFAGSGMTGIAAATRGRRARLSDISVLGRHIATGYLVEVDASKLHAAAEAVVSEARGAIGDMYQTRRLSDSQVVEVARTVWSFTYRCPSCSFHFVYYDHLSNAGTAPPRNCPKCHNEFERRSWPRADDVPVTVVIEGRTGRLEEQPIQDVDLDAVRRAGQDDRLKRVPSVPISGEREMNRRSALGKHQLVDTKLFFSPRNAIALFELWNAINRVPDVSVRRKLRFAFTAILARASRRYQWGPKRPLNAQNQTYYIAPVYFEWNVFDLFLRKVEAAIRSDDEIFRSMPLLNQNISANVQFDLASADALTHLEDCSVDYVFTDPPFGSNIFYSDMSLFHEAWLEQLTDCTREAVIHTCGKNKQGATERYETILQAAFQETYRVLKPGRFMSVVFGNSKGAIWGLVLRALRKAGFWSVPVHVAILDKGQRSVKGLNSGFEGVATVDLVLTVRKPIEGEVTPAEPASHADVVTLLKSALSQLDGVSARNPSYIYAAILREAIRFHQLVDDLHLSDVLIALRNFGYTVDPKSGLLRCCPSER
jgi:16S rRNA G966 N2-methylase RsmD